jgi:hypothetical protein
MVLANTLGGSSSAVERQLPKLNVAGSIPVSRSNPFYFLVSFFVFLQMERIPQLLN